MTDQEMGASIAAALVTLISGILVYQSNRIRNLQKKELQNEYELEKKSIEENVHNLSDDELRKQLDDLTKKSGG